MARRHSAARVAPVTTPPHERQHEETGPFSHADMLRRWRWRDAANVFLGMWLASMPLSLDYREPILALNDVVCGSLIVVLAIVTLSPRFDLARWGICSSAFWLLFAPLVFWTTDARGVPQRHARRRAGHRLLGADSDDAGPGASPGHDAAGAGYAAGLVVQPLRLDPARADHRDGVRRILPVALPGGVPTGTHRLSVGSVLRRRHAAGARLRGLEGLAGLRRRPGRDVLHDRSAVGIHGRPQPLAHDAVDGRHVRRAGRAARHRQHRAGHAAAGRRRRVVHAVPGHGGRDADHDFAGGRRGRRDVAVSPAVRGEREGRSGARSGSAERWTSTSEPAGTASAAPPARDTNRSPARILAAAWTSATCRGIWR